ncbi:MAG: phenylalanine--tRNA ligase subunit alpha [Patescibacteria group bacterium]|nr:phenylalanine--tRNA ligase subunit alpha [Patescibacteria group bacterium]
MIKELEQWHYQEEIDSIKTPQEWEVVNVSLLGRRGKLNQLFQKLKDLPEKERKQAGQRLNQIKREIINLLEAKKKEIDERKKSIFVDPTLPGRKYPQGTLHPLTYVIEEIVSIFSSLGFIRVSYPEVEWEYFSFEALNMPKGHPARDDFETFFIDFPEDKNYGRMLLSPHTSSGQNREMKRVKPPIRMINIAKTYRPNWDATHTPMFHQFEGLCIDRNINVTHLKGTIDYFVKRFFGDKRTIRLRPAHFRFTEPSFEIDVSCGVCQGQESQREKCRVCKSGWLELAGAGMVHPNVLRAGGINPHEYSGWAFGFGPERCMMMREEMKIEDIRILYSGDVRFLERF